MDRYEIFEQAKECEKELADYHLVSFFKSFMPKQRNERWIYLSKKQSPRAYRDSHKLEHLLDFGFSKEIDSETVLSKYKTGVFWDFKDKPIIVSPEDAFILSYYQDGIYSIEPGKKAVFFFHEGGIWLFQK